MNHLSTCGCRACGGPDARAMALYVRRLIAQKRFVAATRGEHLGRRVQPLDLYSALILKGATR